MNYHSDQNRPKSRLIAILCLVLFVLSFSPLFAEYLYLFDPISGKWLPAQMDSNGCLKTSASVSMASASVSIDMSPTNAAIASTTLQIVNLFNTMNSRSSGSESAPLFFVASGSYRGSPDAPFYTFATGTVQTTITNSATQPFYCTATGSADGTSAKPLYMIASETSGGAITSILNLMRANASGTAANPIYAISTGTVPASTGTVGTPTYAIASATPGPLVASTSAYMAHKVEVENNAALGTGLAPGYPKVITLAAGGIVALQNICSDTAIPFQMLIQPTGTAPVVICATTSSTITAYLPFLNAGDVESQYVATNTPIGCYGASDSASLSVRVYK